MQVADQRTDPIRGLVLRLLDLGEHLLGLAYLPSVEVLARHVDLDREPEQELGKVVMQERRDLQSLVLPLLRHPVGERTENVFAILQLLVRLLQRLAPEEHLPSEQQGENEHRHREPSDLKKYACQEQPEDRESEIADYKLTQSSDAQLPDYPDRARPVVKARNQRHHSEVHEVVNCRSQDCRGDELVPRSE